MSMTPSALILTISASILLFVVDLVCSILSLFLLLLPGSLFETKFVKSSALEKDGAPTGLHFSHGVFGSAV